MAHIVSVAEPSAGLLLHLAGDTLAGDLGGELELHGFRVLQPVVYRMRAATALADETVEQLAMGEIEGVILMSPRTATIYVSLMRSTGYLGGAAAGPFLPLRCDSAAAGAAGSGARGDCGGAPAGRSACPDRRGRCKIGRLIG